MRQYPIYSMLLFYCKKIDTQHISDMDNEMQYVNNLTAKIRDVNSNPGSPRLPLKTVYQFCYLLVKRKTTVTSMIYSLSCERRVIVSITLTIPTYRFYEVLTYCVLHITFPR